MMWRGWIEHCFPIMVDCNLKLWDKINSLSPKLFLGQGILLQPQKLKEDSKVSVGIIPSCPSPLSPTQSSCSICFLLLVHVHHPPRCLRSASYLIALSFLSLIHEVLHSFTDLFIHWCINSLTHSFILLIFIEDLLCTRAWREKSVWSLFLYSW